jgi:hypothetical protein
MRILNKWKTPNTKTSWQLSTLPLDQNLNLEQLIEQYNVQSIQVINFDRWKCYARGQAPWDLTLLAYTNWINLKQIAADVDQQHSELVFVAVNKYLLFSEPDSTVDSDYDIAIQQVLTRCLLNYKIVDYQYHYNERGDVGNFVVPDNQFLCKKI